MSPDGNDEIDPIDWKIIEELQKDGRISYAELARRVGLSQSPCWTRVRNLEERGIITGYKAIISQKALGHTQTMIVHVTLERHDDTTMAGFETAVKKMPQITEAFCVIGKEIDFILKVPLRDRSELETFLYEKLHKVPGVKQVSR